MAPQGAGYLSVQNLPAGASSLDVSLYDLDNNAPVTSFAMKVTTNGLYALPSIKVSEVDYSWYAQATNANNGLSAGSFVASTEVEGEENGLAESWFDGRQQLKQNLRFFLRAALRNYPFQFYYPDTGFNYPDVPATANNYTVSGWGIAPTEYDPFLLNVLLENFVFNPAIVNDAGGLSSVQGGFSDVYNPLSTLFQLNDPLAYTYTPPSALTGTIPPVLATNSTRWLDSFSANGNDNYNTEDLAQFGLLYTNNKLIMANNARNFYGLPLVSYLSANGSGITNLVLAGQPDNASAENYFYVETAQPQFQTVEYDFWNYGYPAGDILPEETGFSPTNKTGFSITTVGAPYYKLSGYAKLAVLNGYPNVYAYLAQYFDHAYVVDANGNVTTNTTGVLSSAGLFKATQPGDVALVTMPDVDTGQRGTNIVHVISLVLDKNHDGTMDGSFSGPDTTSQASPMEWWANNGNDGTGIGKDLEVFNSSQANYTYGQIRSQRNLENFFRLWICGLPQLPASQGYTVTLSMTPVTGNPAVNLYPAYESDGGTKYLTDTNVAALQLSTVYVMGTPVIAYGTALGTISSTQSYTLPVDGYGNAVFTHFLFEGAGIGEGQLTMTISQNGNTIAQTSTWLDMHDIKDFYDRAVVTNIISGPSSSWSSAIETEQYASSSALGSDTNLIVFVHGFNVGNWNWLDDSDTVFKRLYWAGFKGHFATVKWPCQTGDPLLFDLSELDAYKASAGVTTYMNQLRSRFPGYRLNILAHSQGNAVVSEAIRNQGLQFDTYILTQGAVAASAYDVNAPTDTTLLNAEVGHPTPDWQPMGYHGVYTNLTGKIISFYNPVDFALQTGSILGVPAANWRANQFLKPDADYGSDGTNVWEYVTGAPNMPITDSEVSRAFVARSRTDAVGATAGLSGVINSSFNLNAQFGFGTTIDEHSAEWTRPIQTSYLYYSQVLTQIQPAP
jgi:hypothetical protein